MKKNKTVAIIGMGTSGRKHFNDWRNVGAEVIAFTTLGEAERENMENTMRTQLGITAKGFRNFEEMIANARPDIVDICTPVKSHYDIARHALASGADIAVERGFTQTLEEATALASLAQQHRKNILLVTPYSILMDVFEEALKNGNHAEISFNRQEKKRQLENMLPDAVSLIPPSYQLRVISTKYEEGQLSRTLTHYCHLQKGITTIPLTISVAANSLWRKEIYFAVDSRRYDLSKRSSKNMELYFVVRNPNGEVREVPFPRRTLFRFLLSQGSYSGPFVNENGVRSMHYLMEMKKK